MSGIVLPFVISRDVTHETLALPKPYMNMTGDEAVVGNILFG